MPDLQEVFRLSTQNAHPAHGALQRQHRRQDRRDRNRRIGTYAVVAVVAIGLVAIVLAARPMPRDGTLTNPSVSLRTTVPIGVQVVGADGTPEQQFTGFHEGASTVRMSPDGSTIAFYYGGEVAVVGADGGAPTYLTSGPNDNVGDAMNAVSWSPDGSQLAYTMSGNVWVMNADGTGQRRLTSASPGVGNYYPAWSPDGTTIAYWRGSDGGVDGGPRDAEIYTIPATGGTPSRLTDDHEPDIEPAWSPDSGRIAYWHGSELWVMDADGSHQHFVFRNGGGSWAPAWSPDGKRIAFLRYVANPSGRLPLLEVRILDLRSGKVTTLDMRVGTDLNGPQWVTNDTLLVNRYD